MEAERVEDRESPPAGRRNLVQRGQFLGDGEPSQDCHKLNPRSLGDQLQVRLVLEPKAFQGAVDRLHHGFAVDKLESVLSAQVLLLHDSFDYGRHCGVVAEDAYKKALGRRDLEQDLVRLQVFEVVQFVQRFLDFTLAFHFQGLGGLQARESVVQLRFDLCQFIGIFGSVSV